MYLIDIGAHIPGSADARAKDIYEEAMHFPGMRVCQNHEPIKDIMGTVGYNIRYPEHWYGDFLAQLELSLWTAEKRVKGLCEAFWYKSCKGVFFGSVRLRRRNSKSFPRLEERM